MSHKNLEEIFEGVDNTNENDVEELALSDDHEDVEQDNEEDNDNHSEDQDICSQRSNDTYNTDQEEPSESDFKNHYKKIAGCLSSNNLIKIGDKATLSNAMKDKTFAIWKKQFTNLRKELMDHKDAQANMKSKSELQQKESDASDLEHLYYKVAARFAEIQRLQSKRTAPIPASPPTLTRKPGVTPSSPGNPAQEVFVTTTANYAKLEPINKITEESVRTFQEKWKVTAAQTNNVLQILHFFTAKAKMEAAIVFNDAGKTSPTNQWTNWPADDILTKLLQCLRQKKNKVSSKDAVFKTVQGINLHFDFSNPKTTFLQARRTIIECLLLLGLMETDEVDDAGAIKPANFAKTLCNTLLENCLKTATSTPVNLRENVITSIVDNIRKDALYTNGNYSFSLLFQLLGKEMENHARIVEFNMKYHMVQSGSINKNPRERDVLTNSKPNKLAKQDANRIPKKSEIQTNSTTTDEVKFGCGGCGRNHVDRVNCKFQNMNHPDFNKSGDWDTSDIGKFYKSLNESGLKGELQRSGDRLIRRDITHDPKLVYKPKNNKSKSKCNLCTIITQNSYSNNTIISTTFQQNKNQLRCHDTLLDSGAEGGSYVNGDTATWLIANGATRENKRKIVCSCFGDCKYVENSIRTEIIFNNVNNQRDLIIPLEFWIIENLPHEVVIGNKDIENNRNLYNLFHEQSEVLPLEHQVPTKKSKLKNTKRSRSISNVRSNISQGSPDITSLSEPEKASENDSLQLSDSDSSSNKHLLQRDTKESVISQSGVQPKPVIPVGTTLHVSKLLDFEPDANGIPDSWDSLDEYLNAERLLVVQDSTQNLLPTCIEGPVSLRKQIKERLEEYKDLFRRDVSRTPAKLHSAYELRVDDTKWKSMRGNYNVPARTQSEEKNKEIKRQIDKLLDLNVIQHSNATRYSQVHLVKKPQPNNGWRFCIDFVQLNNCCESESWNLPNIKEMLYRIGARRPKYFAIMDLTSGYHQAPLGTHSQKYTAFMTFMGIFEWVRLPMGLKGAASYFQKMLTTEVLIGLLYVVCELYIDDIIVYASTEEDFVRNLTAVFERLQSHNITLNPDKCKFGLPSIEYVGHVIDETGTNFSQEKLDEVLAIKPPTYSKEMKSFLGLTSWFRDHIQNFATMAKPLQDMIADYDKKRKLVWTDEGMKAFHQIRKAINECPKLFFVDNDSPIFLHTDASDYGIGAYLFQVISQKEIPIAFMSKTLTTAEIKWSTIEKELYSIVYGLHKLEYLLRDKRFTLRTDHKNLTYANEPPSAKVRRWKIAIQGYDFNIEHIPGVDNVVADGLSRLLPIDVEVMCILKGMKVPDDKYNMISKVHNSNVGHHGVDRTLNLLKTQGNKWKGMREHVIWFLGNCPCCQKLNTQRVHINGHPFSLAAYRPMESLHIDTLSMCIEDNEGYLYILVVIDGCSRWVELYPIKDLSAETAASALLAHVCTYGQPSQIRSDNGTQFANKIIEQLCELTGIKKVNTTPYSSEENGIVERSNREILRHTRSILFDKGLHREWRQNTPIVKRILNSTVSSVTGCTPAELMLTNPANLQQGLFAPPTPTGTETENVSEWLSNRKALYEKALQIAQKKQKEMEAEKLENASTDYTDFKVGSYVLLRFPDDKSNVGKLKTPLKGPMVVKSRKDNAFELIDITTDTPTTAHISRIVPFYYDESRHDPYEIAQKDRDEEVVECIVRHSPDVITKKTRKSDLQFEVKWLNQSDSHNLWLPWKELSNNTLLHKYLIENGLETLIPRQFQS